MCLLSRQGDTPPRTMSTNVGHYSTPVWQPFPASAALEGVVFPPVVASRPIPIFAFLGGPFSSTSLQNKLGCTTSTENTNPSIHQEISNDRRTYCTQHGSRCRRQPLERCSVLRSPSSLVVEGLIWSICGGAFRFVCPKKHPERSPVLMQESVCRSDERR